MKLSDEVHTKMIAFFISGLSLGIFLSIFWDLPFFDILWGNEIISFVTFIVVILVVGYFIKEPSDKVARLEQELIKNTSTIKN